MSEALYLVKGDFNHIIAKELDLDTALILVEALFNKYYKERDIGYSIIKMVEEELEK